MPYNKAARQIQIIPQGRDDGMTSLVPRNNGAKDGHGPARDRLAKSRGDSVAKP
jgi:hypothetical protein